MRNFKLVKKDAISGVESNIKSFQSLDLAIDYLLTARELFGQNYSTLFFISDLDGDKLFADGGGVKKYLSIISFKHLVKMRTNAENTMAKTCKTYLLLERAIKDYNKKTFNRIPLLVNALIWNMKRENKEKFLKVQMGDLLSFIEDGFTEKDYNKFFENL